MPEVTIYGASDDLIEVEGAISEEFSAYDMGDGMYLAFSDGTVLHVQYGANDEGMWRIGLRSRGTATYEHTPATDERDDYSDRVTLTGDNLRWCVLGKSMAKASKVPA